MILGSPTYVALLALAAGIILLYFLNTHRQRREVPALYLWTTLPSDPRTRAARIWVRIDALLLLQLLVLVAVVAALAQPAFVTKRPRLASLAIVLDGSASLRGRSAEGTPASGLVRAEALALLDRYPTTPVALLELSASPHVLAPLSADHDLAQRVLAAWEPTWFGNGTGEDLAGLLASQGGSFERAVLLTDCRPPFSLPGLEFVLFPPGENLALTAFSVREDPNGMGPVAFLRVRNDTPSYREVTVHVSDGSRRASFPAIVAPGEEPSYVFPFPGSAGSVFTAAIEGEDAFPADDSRTFSLARKMEWRIRVVGQMDRYLRSALASVSGARFLNATDSVPADVTVVCGVPLPEGVSGGVLLVHSSLPGVLEIGEEHIGDPGGLVVDVPGDPLLQSIDPLDFVIRNAPAVRDLAGGVTVLSEGGEPILWRAELPERRVVLLAPDPLKTNLPLTVDFPILVWNILHWLSLTDPSAPPSSVVAGEPIPFALYGVPERLVDPSGRETGIDPSAVGFLAKAPGVYQLITSSGTYAVAVNVAGSESPRPVSQVTVTTGAREGREAIETGLLPAWPMAAALALALLILESASYQRLRLPRRRT